MQISTFGDVPSQKLHERSPFHALTRAASRADAERVRTGNRRRAGVCARAQLGCEWRRNRAATLMRAGHEAVDAVVFGSGGCCWCSISGRPRTSPIMVDAVSHVISPLCVDVDASSQYLTLLRGTGVSRAEKSAHQPRDFVRRCVQREMPRVEDVHVGVRDVAPIGIGLGEFE